MESQKVRMTHNEFVDYMKANANRVHTEKGYSMADYNRDCDNVEVLDYDLSRFGLSFSAEQLKVINLFFTEERVNRFGHTLLEGHLMNSSEHMVANTLGFDMVTNRGYSGFGKSDENKCVFEFCEGDIYLTLCETAKDYNDELESFCQFYEIEDRLPDLVLVDNRKGAYLHGGDDPGYDEYDVADSYRKVTLASVETAVSAWLSGFQKEGVFAAITGLDINSNDYKEMLALVESLCEQEFPELHSAVFGDGAGTTDLIFRDKDQSDAYNLYYYNPDSNAGGLIEQCPFCKEDAAEMIDNEGYMDVLATHTHYLSDVDTEHFFNTIFELIELKQNGYYLGNDLSEVCKSIVGEVSDMTRWYGDVDIPFNYSELYVGGFKSIADGGVNIISSRLKAIPEFSDVSVECFDEYEAGYGFRFDFCTDAPVDKVRALLKDTLNGLFFEVSYALEGDSLDISLSDAQARSEARGQVGNDKGYEHELN